MPVNERQRSEHAHISRTISPTYCNLLVPWPRCFLRTILCIWFPCFGLHKRTNLAKEVFAVDCGRSVALQLGARVWGQRLQLLAVGRVAQLVVRPLDPVTPKLRQEDEREGALSAQHLFQEERQWHESGVAGGGFGLCPYLVDTRIRNIVLLSLQKVKKQACFFSAKDKNNYNINVYSPMRHLSR